MMTKNGSLKLYFDGEYCKDIANKIDYINNYVPTVGSSVRYPYIIKVSTNIEKKINPDSQS